MGGQFSKQNRNTRSRDALKSYDYDSKSSVDKDLKPYSTNIRSHTMKVINTVADGLKDQGTVSFDTLATITEHLLEMNQEAVKHVLECTKDIWKDQELLDLVEKYFDNSLQTLKSLNKLVECQKGFSESQLAIRWALQQFEEEDKKEGVDGEKYLKSLEGLKKFKASEKSITEEFFKLSKSVCDREKEMLVKLRDRQKQLAKKQKFGKTWRKVSSIIFAVLSTSVLICSIVAAAIVAPPLVAALVAAAAAIPFGDIGRWVDSLWEEWEKELEGQEQVLTPIEKNTLTVITEMGNIEALVARLEIDIKPLSRNADFALLERKGAVKLVMEDMRKQLEDFTKRIEELGKRADRCSNDIINARTEVANRIIQHAKNRKRKRRGSS
ncbi:hypothetical protein HHK36_010068 [Tetracentron sinense]|uniref:Uncharacterized protein n=1 Tax=Tetracentron sinense TaxID=13715 RepID=A0A835DM89_TETSI|nr:hypothetical protein HHK36_010068 [Tetracentron sinense]